MHSFVKLRRSYVTLVETLIAATLLASLLVIIFGFLRELTTINTASEIQQKESFQLRYLETRLQSIFEKVVNERDSSRTFFFYTQEPNYEFSSSASLIFTFDNGIHADPLFSGDVLARLYLDRSNLTTHEQTSRLILATWPLYVSDPQDYLHREVLLDGVISMTLHFYAPPEHLSGEQAIGTKTIITTAPGLTTKNPGNELGQTKEEDVKIPADQWFENEWLFSYRQMPVLMKIDLVVQNTRDMTIKQNSKALGEKTISLYFVLPSSKNPIHFPQDVVP